MTDIKELAQTVKPVVAFDFPKTSGYDLYNRFLKNELPDLLYNITDYEQSPNGYLCHIMPVDLWKIAYTWKPKPATFADNITPFDYFIAKSYYGAPSLFKPSIAEVLQCIPKRLLKNIIAFEINPHKKSTWHCAVEPTHTFLVRAFRDREIAEEEFYRKQNL